MSDILVQFQCGHTRAYQRDLKEEPVCPSCGSKVVARVTAPAPSFTGVSTAHMRHVTKPEPVVTEKPVTPIN